jgi:hypothetical protein
MATWPCGLRTTSKMAPASAGISRCTSNRSSIGPSWPTGALYEGGRYSLRVSTAPCGSSTVPWRV